MHLSEVEVLVGEGVLWVRVTRSASRRKGFILLLNEL